MPGIAQRTETKGRIHDGIVILVMATLAVFASLGLARFSYTMLLPPM